MTNTVKIPDAVKMLPCPFCGSDAKFAYRMDGEDARVICKNWLVDGPNRCMGSGRWENTKEEAIAAWNNRAATAQAPEPEQAREAQYGWLVENGKQGDELRYRTWRDGFSAWTDDPNEATRYARRIDAENVHMHDEDAWRVVEHGWSDMPASLPSPAPQTAQEAAALAKDAETYLSGLGFDAAPSVPSEREAVPDGVWEALQRLIENAATLGPASREDAITVARWRGKFHSAALDSPAPREMEVSDGDEEHAMRMVDNTIPFRLGLIEKGECIDASVETIREALLDIRKVLLARSRTATPPGYVLVPKEPTEVMYDAAHVALEANWKENGAYTKSSAAVSWRAMIDAAPSADKGGEQ